MQAGFVANNSGHGLRTVGRARVAQLQTRAAELQGRRTKVTALQTAQATTTSNVTALQTTVATLKRGEGNVVTGKDAFVGAGGSNTASAGYSVVGGGANNIASGFVATVAGGGSNTASGTFAAVAGGTRNTASGWTSLAAGYMANAQYDGCFVWGDFDNQRQAQVSFDQGNQWMVYASGGVVFRSSSSGSSGVSLAPGGGAWNSLSDRNAKDSFATISPTEVLEKVVAMPVSSWAYKTEKGVTHLGPMAQDFYEAFKLGSDDHLMAQDTCLASGAHSHLESPGGRVLTVGSLLFSRVRSEKCQHRPGRPQYEAAKIASSAGVSIEQSSQPSNSAGSVSATRARGGWWFTLPDGDDEVRRVRLEGSRPRVVKRRRTLTLPGNQLLPSRVR